jgi:hypothetical protein
VVRVPEQVLAVEALAFLRLPLLAAAVVLPPLLVPVLAEEEVVGLRLPLLAAAEPLQPVLVVVAQGQVLGLAPERGGSLCGAVLAPLPDLGPKTRRTVRECAT